MLLHLQVQVQNSICIWPQSLIYLPVPYSSTSTVGTVFLMESVVSQGVATGRLSLSSKLSHPYFRKTREILTLSKLSQTNLTLTLLNFSEQFSRRRPVISVSIWNFVK